MTIFQAILLAILYYLCNSTWGLGVGWWTLMRPLVSGFLTGIVLGNPVQGAIIGAQINILYLGFIGGGGAVPSDIALAGVVGTAIAITGNLDVNTAMALAVPVGLLGTIIWVSKLTLNVVFVRLCEKYINEGDNKKYFIANVILPQLYLFVVSFVSCFVIVYFGASYITNILDFLGHKVLGALNVVGGMLPAVGIALTLSSIFERNSIPFFFLGFFMVQYFKLNMIAIGFFGIIATYIYMQLYSNKNDGSINNVNSNMDISNEIDSRFVLLDKKTINKSWLRWVMFNQANYNYERMQGTGYAHALLPVIEKLYPNDPDKQRERMQLHMSFFNTEPQWGACIIGIGAALEEKKAQGNKEIEDELVTSIKSGLMGPIAGIGDTINGGVITPLVLSFFIGIAQKGNLLGPIGYIIIEAFIMWSIYYFSYKLGYEKGSDAIVDLLESGKIKKLITAASILGCMVIGGLVSNFVNLSTGISFNLGGKDLFSIQEQLFDLILPGMLPLLLTLGCYWMITKKKVSSTKLILILFIIGIIGGLTGILV